MRYYCDRKRHLVCVPYSIEGLHAMAARLRIGHWWFHRGTNPHYDIPKTRQAEIEAHCTVVSPRTIYRIIKGETP